MSDEIPEGPPEINSSGEVEPPKRKRGRPPGSKNKTSKAKRQDVDGITVDALPDDLVQQVALMPITIPAAILGRTKGIAVVVNPKFAMGLPIVFKEWLKSMDFRLTPGWALALMYASCLATAEYRSIDEVKKAQGVENVVQNPGIRTDNPTPQGSAETATA